MRGKRYTSEGIILARKNYSEADRILKLFTKHYGKVSAIAKGVRKPKSRKRGSLEVFGHIRFAASRGKTFDLMTEVEIIDSFEPVRKDLKRSAVAYYLIEVVERTMRDEEENRQVFNLLLDTLSDLQNSQKTKELKDDFVYKTLVLLGFWPRGKRISNTNRAIEEILERRLTSARVGKKVLS